MVTECLAQNLLYSFPSSLRKVDAVVDSSYEGEVKQGCELLGRQSTNSCVPRTLVHTAEGQRLISTSERHTPSRLTWTSAMSS